MAAVAGAVADEVLAAMLAGDHRLAKAYVNDGGDIALYLAPGERLTAGLVADLQHPAIVATTTIRRRCRSRGIATSGHGGRSFSLGIADAVTVLAAGRRRRRRHRHPDPQQRRQHRQPCCIEGAVRRAICNRTATSARWRCIGCGWSPQPP
ncbi:MAG: hypothetical protein U1E38_09645 [Rhodospirillales bacterium]